MKRFAFLVCAAVVFTTVVSAETLLLPMSDGVKLATDYFVPEGEGPFPVVLVRTTYGRGHHGGEATGFNTMGIAFVSQDTRGRGGSEGTDMAFGDDGWGEHDDGAETIAWIKGQPWCNGKIGTIGGSALGITQSLLAGATQDLTAQVMVVAGANFYDHLTYQGGVFRKSLCEGWLKAQGSEHVIDVWKSHPTYDDFWERHNVTARAPQITAPAVHIGGWFDIFAKGTLDNFTSREYHGAGPARGNQILVMGPWIHGVRQDIGDLRFPDNFQYDFGKLQDKFLRHWLLGEENGVMDAPRVHYYTMGDCEDADAPGNEWRTADGWPPVETTPTRYYLSNAGALVTSPPTDGGSSSYRYEPKDPCPTKGGPNLLLPAGPYDQRAIGERGDVLKFVTGPLDSAVEITGAVSVELYISSDAADTDFTGKLIDVYPDGKEILILDNIQRVKFRDGFTEPKLLPPGEVGKVTIDLFSTSLIINKGHRIGLHVSSSNYPRFEKNPNSGDDFPVDDNIRAANNTVHFGRATPSALVLPVRN